MSQLVYNDNFTAARPGQLNDVGPADIVTRFSAVDLVFGRFVSKHDAVGKVKLPAAGGDIAAATLEGVVVATQAIESIADGLLPHYKANDAANILRKGRIWVYSETAFSLTDVLFIRHTTNGALVPGNVRNDADTANAASAATLPIKVLSTLTAAGNLLIEVSLP